MGKMKLGVSYLCLDCEAHWYDDDKGCPECGSTDLIGDENGDSDSISHKDLDSLLSLEDIE